MTDRIATSVQLIPVEKTNNVNKNFTLFSLLVSAVRGMHGKIKHRN
jgi:hypothetical protein